MGFIRADRKTHAHTPWKVRDTVQERGQERSFGSRLQLGRRKARMGSGTLECESTGRGEAGRLSNDFRMGAGEGARIGGRRWVVGGAERHREQAREPGGGRGFLREGRPGGAVFRGKRDRRVRVDQP